MEKTIVFALATGQKRFSASLCKLVEKYAEILASQGLLTTAMEYLNLLGTEELSTEITILRDRIARSTEPGMSLCYFVFYMFSWYFSTKGLQFFATIALTACTRKYDNLMVRKDLLSVVLLYGELWTYIGCIDYMLLLKGYIFTTLII